jgi:ankyrin repeat protein
VQILIEAGADINKPSYSGWTPLSLATMKGCETILQMLLEAGADTDLRI